MSENGALVDLSAIRPTRIWNDVVARIVTGERITLAVVEIPPGGIVPEHRHPHEQLGVCLRGSATFRVGDRERRLTPGGTWRIPPNVPHQVVAGPAGAVCLDVFSPTRDDWTELAAAPRATPLWPPATGDS